MKPAASVLRAAFFAGCAAVIAASPALAAGAPDPLAPAGRWTAPDRGQAKTPPMGWNSWNAFASEVSEEKVLGSANALVDTGLAKLGYVYVNIDDGWMLKRRLSDGRLQVRTDTFPSARVGGAEETSFRPLVDRLHGMGLKAGIYDDAGRNTCSQAYNLTAPTLPVGSTAEREVGLYGHIDEDMPVFFKDWAFDYVKVDACGLADYAPGSERVKAGAYRGLEPLFLRGFPNRSDIAGVRALYQHIADAIARARPAGDYVYSICAWGQADVRAWGKEVGNLWRTSDDLTPSWTRMLHTFDSAADRPLYAHPGHWNDPDMLFVGKGDFDLSHLTEARTHFSLWAIESAPLIIGYDLRNAPKPLLDIFSNADVVAVDQDPAGNQGVIAYSSDDIQIIVKTLSDGSKAVVLFNRGLKPIFATLTADQLKFAPDAPIALKDLWSKETLSFKGEHGFSLAPRESRMFVARGERELKDGVYLSEIPGSINVAVDGVVRPELDPTVHRMASPWAPGTHGSGERPFYTGWGGAQADAAPYGTALQVAGHEFRSGLGLLAGSRMEVKNAGYRRFHALAGVDDNSRNPAMRVRFYVYGDGKLLKASAPVKLGDAAVALDAPIAGVKIVELVARPERAELTPASIAWGEASLSR